MKINFKKPFLSFDGQPMKEIISEEIGRSLFSAQRLDGKALTADEKYMAYKLSMRLLNHDEIELSTEEASFIKKVCSETIIAGAYGQIVDLIENSK